MYTQIYTHVSNEIICSIWRRDLTETAGQHSETLHKRCFFVHCARNRCSGVLGSHWALELTARECSEASAGNHCSSWFLVPRQDLKPQHWRRLFAHCARHHCLSVLGRLLVARNHGQGVLRSQLAVESVARQSYLVFDRTFIFPAKPCSKSPSCDLCIVSCCFLRDFTSTVRRHMRI